MADAAILLDADPALIRKAQAIGLSELTANLAGKKPDNEDRGWKRRRSSVPGCEPRPSAIRA